MVEIDRCRSISGVNGAETAPISRFAVQLSFYAFGSTKRRLTTVDTIQNKLTAHQKFERQRHPPPLRPPFGEQKAGFYLSSAGSEERGTGTDESDGRGQSKLAQVQRRRHLTNKGGVHTSSELGEGLQDLDVM
ncbi:hypothetical protein GW17_00014392 [Ensete ventricosum]|nr:hypothetical protein GW17_00014392 [Ensete ventricosum]